MAASSITPLLKHLDDITECPICCEPFADPRSLPCIHAYCLKCLQKYANDKQPGDKMPCPLCRKEFTIPEGGLKALAKNCFLEKLLDMKQMSSVYAKPPDCEMCKARKETPVNLATVYCVECQEVYCGTCSDVHRQLKATRMHKQVELGNSTQEGNVEELIPKAAPSYCDKHADQKLGVFCSDCRVAICVICYIDSHKQHECSDINKVADSFRQRITTDVDFLLEGVKKLREMSASVRQQKETFVKRVAETEDEITKSCEDLKNLIKRNNQTLLNEMVTKKQNVLKRLDGLNHEIAQQVSLMENLKKYSEELASKGAASHVARETSVLHERTQELLKYDEIQRSRDDLHCIAVRFTDSSRLESKTNLLGTVDVIVTGITVVPEVKLKQPELTGSFTAGGGGEVTGVISHGSHLYVVRRDAANVIEVYDASTLTKQRNISVPGVSYTFGLAFCSKYRCLYVCQYTSKTLYRVDQSASDNVTSWMVEQYAAGLAVTSSHNVLVSCLHRHKLQEYTTHGKVLREIMLESKVWYAIQLPNDQFAVTLHDNRVCLVDANGTVIKTSDSAAGQFRNPRELMQLSNGCIFLLPTAETVG